MRRLLAILVLATVLGGVAMSGARAHKPSDSYLILDLHDGQVTGQWDIALRDLDYALGLDSDNDGVITWGELRAHHEAIAAYALSHLTLHGNGAACPLRPTEHLVDDHSDGAYEVLRFTADCPAAPAVLAVRYDLFFDLDPQHRGLLRLEESGGTHTTVFGPAHDTWELTGRPTSVGQQFADYLRFGVWHIWTGFDHILFLSALLLPAVLERRTGRWQAVASFKAAFVAVFKIVSAFTLAHSLTLSLAVFGLIDLPSRLVESTIAATVIAAALNNLWPVVEKRLWLVAFVFGLVHGLGFANVLTELGLARQSLAVALVGFNLGVEAGQLAIVAAFLPPAFLLRLSWVYPRIVLGAGSFCIAAIALVWLLERGFDVSIFF